MRPLNRLEPAPRLEELPRAVVMLWPCAVVPGAWIPCLKTSQSTLMVIEAARVLTAKNCEDREAHLTRPERATLKRPKSRSQL